MGPEPASTYWRRRLLVGLAALVALVLIWIIVSPGGDGDDVAPVADASTSAPPAPSPSGSTTESPSASPTTSGAACLDSDIQVSVAPEQQNWSLGSSPVFIMKIANAGAAACTRDVGPKNNTFTVSSGGYRVWSSDDCSPAGDPQVELIAPGEAFEVKSTWNSKITQVGCPKPLRDAEAGAYAVVANNGEAKSPSVSFSLTQ